MCLQAVLASAQEPFDEGVRTERRLARVLFASKQAAALQYAFFATRAAPKVTVKMHADKTMDRLQASLKKAQILSSSRVDGGELIVVSFY